jgi:LacI family transcriptional regulator
MKRKSQTRTRKSVLLALGWYVQEIALGVARYARQAGWELNDTTSHNGMIPSAWDGDGIITLIPGRRHKERIAFVLNAGVPVVDLSDQLPELPFSRVLPDNLAIGRIAAEHFLCRGFMNLAFYSLDSRAPVVRERMEGFRLAVAARGRNFIAVDYTPMLKSSGAMKRLLEWLQRELAKLPKPVAIMAQYDGEANDVLRACVEAGIRVPEEVAVVGVDNDPIYRDLGPLPLSSVESNRELIGFRGAELLDRLMKGGEPPKHPIRISPGGVVVRRSSDVVAVDDPAVLRAAEFIAQHHTDPITVDDIVRFSGASRRTLYARFEQQVGHSILKELIRQRMEKAKQLLRDTDVKLQDVAERSGLREAEYLSKCFRYHEGLSVSDYRRMFQQKI